MTSRPIIWKKGNAYEFYSVKSSPKAKLIYLNGYFIPLKSLSNIYKRKKRLSYFEKIRENLVCEISNFRYVNKSEKTGKLKPIVSNKFFFFVFKKDYNINNSKVKEFDTIEEAKAYAQLYLEKVIVNYYFVSEKRKALIEKKKVKSSRNKK